MVKTVIDRILVVIVIAVLAFWALNHRYVIVATGGPGGYKMDRLTGETSWLLRNTEKNIQKE